MNLVSNANMSSSFESPTMNVDNLDKALLQVSYSGSPVGTLSVAFSNDGDVWDVLPVTVRSVSGAGSISYAIRGIPAALMKLVYTATSGSGLLNATIRGKCYQHKQLVT